ncbi:4-oxalomesaconate tautomerase [Larsenimonas salina]|uniref:4-oxalomesaconate tautomerase n=1 Tax=Larsenimonas salina TaxID=1295565 RepID=UPI0020748093|nr:4-oxalomesaconate tautomerase [Larsenimonas salina]MCM5704678.1 4-oxalomesaconate tautomerase [Larsenimonas salina]
MQTAIPCMQIRGGTSKGVYFLEQDLPPEGALRDHVLLAVMGSPDRRQIDGLGGGTSLTSKVAIVSPSSHPMADVDYLFAQVVVDDAHVDYGQNCGNILAGVAPFALESGLIDAHTPTTSVRVHMVNSGQLATIDVATPNGKIEYQGTTHISGVPGEAAALTVYFEDTAGANCGALMPTGHVRDRLAETDVTCIDNGMPVVLIRAEDLGISGHESPQDLERNDTLRARLEAIRLEAGPVMNLGNVKARTVPKLSIIAPATGSGTLTTRTFIPHRCHEAIGVLGAVSVASACLIEGSVAASYFDAPPSGRAEISIEHPTGDFTVSLMTNDQGQIEQSGVIRTARLLSKGHVYIPSAVWPGV